MAMQREPEPQVIELREFFGVVRRRRLSIVLVTVLVVGLAVFMVARRTPLYSSTARVEVRPLIAGGDLQGFYYDLLSNMDTEAQRVTSRDVATLAAEELGVVAEGEQLTVDQLSGVTADVSTSIPANTTYIDITCTTLVPVEAQACANAFAVAYVEDRTALAQESADAARQGVEEEIDEAQKRIAALQTELDAATDPATQAALADEIDTEERAIDTARLQLLAVPTASPNPALLALPAPLPDRAVEQGLRHHERARGDRGARARHRTRVRARAARRAGRAARGHGDRDRGSGARRRAAGALVAQPRRRPPRHDRRPRYRDRRGLPHGADDADVPGLARGHQGHRGDRAR